MIVVEHAGKSSLLRADPHPVLTQLKRGYSKEQRSFESLAIYVETRYLEMKAYDGEANLFPTRIKAAISADLLFKLSRCMGRFSSIMNPLLWELLNCIFVDFPVAEARVPPERLLSALSDNETFFENCEEMRNRIEELEIDAGIHQQGLMLKDVVKRFQTVRLAFNGPELFLRDTCFKLWLKQTRIMRKARRKADRMHLKYRFKRWKMYLGGKAYHHLANKIDAKIEQLAVIDKQEKERRQSMVLSSIPMINNGRASFVSSSVTPSSPLSVNKQPSTTAMRSSFLSSAAIAAATASATASASAAAAFSSSTRTSQPVIKLPKFNSTLVSHSEDEHDDHDNHDHNRKGGLTAVTPSSPPTKNMTRASVTSRISFSVEREESVPLTTSNSSRPLVEVLAVDGLCHLIGFIFEQLMLLGLMEGEPLLDFALQAFETRYQDADTALKIFTSFTAGCKEHYKKHKRIEVFVKLACLPVDDIASLGGFYVTESVPFFCHMLVVLCAEQPFSLLNCIATQTIEKEILLDKLPIIFPGMEREDRHYLKLVGAVIDLRILVWRSDKDCRVDFDAALDLLMSHVMYEQHAHLRLQTMVGLKASAESKAKK